MKAKELVWKYYHNIEHAISNEYADKDWEIAKQCSLIAVDELIKSGASEYWQEVKNDIQNL